MLIIPAAKLYRCSAFDRTQEVTLETRKPSRPGDEAGVAKPFDTSSRIFASGSFLFQVAGKALTEMTGKLRKIEGTVRDYKALGVHNVQLEIQGANNLIDLNVEQPWMLRIGDHIAVAGEDDGRSGKFYGYAYRNDTREAFGKSDPGLLDGVRYIVMGLVFSWAIFPLFIHIPAGLRQLAFGRKIDQAAAMLWAEHG